MNKLTSITLATVFWILVALAVTGINVYVDALVFVFVIYISIRFIIVSDRLYKEGVR
jgi:hypothetical protein